MRVLPKHTTGTMGAPLASASLTRPLRLLILYVSFLVVRSVDENIPAIPSAATRTDSPRESAARIALRDAAMHPAAMQMCRHTACGRPEQVVLRT